jgi:WD40 repeat protein
MWDITGGGGIVRWWRLAAVMLAGALAAAAATVLAVAVNVATGGTARWFPAVERHPLWWTAGATAAVALAGLLVWAAQRWYDRALKELIPARQLPEPWVVDRPAEVNQVVRAVRRSRGGTVGITTAVRGAGGFGKTTVAKLVRADRRVMRRFRGRVYWVTIGRDAGKESLAGLVNGLITQVQPDHPVTFTDARQAGEHLAAVVAKGPRRLLILDDVWTDGQLAVFQVAGRCARLVTTRNPSLAAGAVVPVEVDQMSQTQALALLTAGLPPLQPVVAAGLVQETRRWPLLLRLVNKILADQARLQLDVTAAAEDLLARLRADGALQVDPLTGAAAQQLDVSDPDQRNKAVRATIEASTSLLSPAELDRLAELAVFAEDEMIPVTLIMTLWQITGGLDTMAAGALCARLADLALVTLTPSADGGTVAMHDVVRDFLRGELGDIRLAELHQVLLDGVAAGLPRAPAADRDIRTVTAWWELPESARYLWEHLVEHMAAARRADDAEQVAGDLRWVGARLRAFGPAGPYADLVLIGSPRADRLRRVLGQAAHLLTPTEPPHSLIDILYSRVSHDPEWATQIQALIPGRKLPTLVNRWPLPDSPDPAQLRTLAGRTPLTSEVRAIAITPDGAWLATAERHGVRVWDLATGRQTATLTGDTRVQMAIAFAPDGSWLATAGWGKVRVWDPATGRQTGGPMYAGVARRMAVAPDGAWLATAGWGKVQVWAPATWRQTATLAGHKKIVTAMTAAPDGSWLATAGQDGVRVWDPATWRQTATLAGHSQVVEVMTAAPDGSWLATAGQDGVRVWDPATWRQTATLAGHTSTVRAMAAAPDGAWLATAWWDGPVRVWDPATGRQTATLADHTSKVTAMAAAPDGAWLATAGQDGPVRVWDPATWRQTATLSGDTSKVTAMAAAPDGAWLATAGWDGPVRVWDPSPSQPRAASIRHIGPVSAVAFAPDGGWLATAGQEGVRIWDPATGREHPTVISCTTPAWHVAIGPGGGWLATAGEEGVRIWDPATGQYRTIQTGSFTRVTAVAAAPDGTWLATAEQARPVRGWDPATGQQLFCLAEPQRFELFGHPKRAMKVAIAPDGRWLAATATRDESVQIWDLTTGQQLFCLAEPQRFSPFRDARRAIGAAKARRGIWGWLARGTEVRSVTAVVTAPDGTWLASAFSDGPVRIWDLATRQPRATLSGHTGEVTALAVAPDGTWLATAGQDGSVRIWDPATGLISAVMRVDGPLRDCCWSPSGQSLAAAGDNGLYLFTFQAPGSGSSR